GTVITFLPQPGRTLADQTAAADVTKTLPLDMGGVEVYFDGIRSPLLFVSPDEVRAQVPFEVQDANSISAYIRIQRDSGVVDVSAAVAVPISQWNPGLFATCNPDQTCPDPRPAMAFHSSSYATGSVLLDGLISPGDKVHILVEDRDYT